MEYQAKVNEKYLPVLKYISSFEGIFYKKLQRDSYHFFYFLLFDISFYISRYYFLQLFSKLSKKNFRYEFPVFNRFI